MAKIITALFTVIFSLLSSVGIASGNTDAWSLDIPAYEGGRICDEIYLDGSGMLSDELGPTGIESRMELVKYTNEEEYFDYCASLEEAGFDNVYSNSLGGVICNAFRYENKLYYTYLSSNRDEVRIIEDNNTNSFEDFGYARDDGEGVTIYQFDYPYADFGEHKNEDIYSTNGMMYIIRLSDNSLIIVDGGSIRQSSDENINQCMSFLHKITGTEEGEKVRIALWYGTHGHSDHVTFFYKLIGFWHDDIQLERVMFNYPSLSLVEHDGRIDMYRERLAELYPDVSYLCPHTGMSFSIANTKIDVLYTQEDAVNALTGKTPVTNANDGSTVCMITAAGKKFLVLGDINILAQDKILATHNGDLLECDVLQAAHHLYNADALIYDYASAEYVLCPMSQGRGAWLPGNAAARLFYKKSQMLYAGNAMYIIEMTNDGLKLSESHTSCVPYDDSSMNEIH